MNDLPNNYDDHGAADDAQRAKIAALETEVERLTAERDEAERTLATIKDEYPKLRSQVLRLTAERDGLANDPRLALGKGTLTVERLRMVADYASRSLGAWPSNKDIHEAIGALNEALDSLGNGGTE